MTAKHWVRGRKILKLKQAQAATALHISQPYLSQLEKGTRVATPDLVRRAMDLYRLPPTVLPVPRRRRPSRSVRIFLRRNSLRSAIRDSLMSVQGTRAILLRYFSARSLSPTSTQSL